MFCWCYSIGDQLARWSSESPSHASSIFIWELISQFNTDNVFRSTPWVLNLPRLNRFHVLTSSTTTNNKNNNNNKQTNKRISPPILYQLSSVIEPSHHHSTHLATPSQHSGVVIIISHWFLFRLVFRKRDRIGMRLLRLESMWKGGWRRLIVLGDNKRVREVRRRCKIGYHCCLLLIVLP